jgi:DNA-binding LytR/AlgR family response regulator
LRQAPIVALSAEDHYVRVRTDRGQALILMNFANAVAALGPDAGVRIHRSHWVSRALAAKTTTSGSRNGIRVGDDTVLPVSRAGRKLLNELQEPSA